MQIIQGTAQGLFNALRRLGISTLDQDFKVEQIELRRFDDGTQGCARLVGTFLGPTAKVTLPLLVGTGSCTTDVLTLKTVEVALLAGRLYEVRRWTGAAKPEISLGSDVELVSELEKLIEQRASVTRVLADLEAKIHIERKKHHA